MTNAKKLSNSKKEAQKLKDALKKEKQVIEATKNSEAIINANLDNNSLMNELAKLTLNEVTDGSNVQMFRFDSLIKDFDKLTKEDKQKETKKIRKRARKQAKNFMNNICLSFKAKDKKKLKDLIISFNIFYKEYYVLNDYSIKSICRNSSDKDRLILFTLGLQVIKNNK